MSSSASPPEKSGSTRPTLTVLRVVIWIIVAGVGLSLVISGIVGIVAKGG